MCDTSTSCQHLINLRKISRDYEQYYIGDKDEEKRKSGEGRNHWTGAQSLELYDGRFLRDTMHGLGDYFWRCRGPENAFITYEGHFYCNQIHGYGTMSYPNGKTFNGLFFNNVRWGPGVECHANLRDNVGLWRGSQLVRLVWQPSAPNVVPDFMAINSGRTIVESHRIILTTKIEIVGEVNNALELLKQHGADPIVAVNKWSKLYPKHCTDIRSPLCHVDFFNYDYYEGKIYTLHETDNIPQEVQNDNEEIGTYYVWNNNSVIIDMMKHCYKHEKQRNVSILDLKSILSGPRTQFKSAGSHELQCRTLLMACYLGYITEVTQLINENKIHPDICDGQGNSAIMYAVCGDQPEIIHFLIEAGANVDFCNDSCCTPLSVALMRYTCAQNNIAPNGMLYALLPPAPPVTPAPLPSEQKVFEWNLVRSQLSTSTGGTVMRSPSKTARNMSSKKIKSLVSLRDQSTSKRKPDSLFKIPEPDRESLSEEQELYNDITREYCIRVTDYFTLPSVTTSNLYLFDVVDMIKEIEANEEDQKKQSEKNPKKVLSKTIKETIKTSKEVLWDSNEKENQSIDSKDEPKIAMLSKIMSTILQLLSDGADPKSVRCPHSALFIALTSNCPNLVRHLIHNGAYIHETYPQIFDYSCLDMVVSRPFTQANFEIIKALLENGADASHRLVYKQETKDATNPYLMIPGPTLLHVVLGKKTENSNEEDIRRQLLRLFLEYNCNPTALFKGRSAIDIAMTKSMELLNIFIEHPKSDLNAIINDTNQSILVKFFSISYFRSYTGTERLSTLTNLLLFGADPLIKCQNGEDSYQNIFVFTKKTLNEMDTNSKLTSQPIGKQDLKGKKSDKPKKDEKLSNKSMGKMTADEVEDYKQAIDLMTDCARLIYIRWLQTKLLKKLVETINKYRHRHWNIIMKELHTDIFGIWLTPLRCLEIWDILSNSKKKIYNDKRILRHLLCIVIFMSWKNYGQKNISKVSAQILTDSLKNLIESDVTRLLRQQNVRKKQTSEFDTETFNLSYIKPELVTDGEKFNVCFECIQPLNENKIICNWCELISFCSLECIKTSIYRGDCHPCSDFLKSIYFSNTEEDVKSIPSKSEDIAMNKK
ncbi:unnamed protein product [Euphydryas editha]|uniref:Ankyrin repeat and MYND domain-containing protein 1 n=1 Tax=Euphydryas editha TaxID=104508 RepID=A0AAU9UR74_EUPED|nr:unnamed protein product [Euphydryas editha]